MDLLGSLKEALSLGSTVNFWLIGVIVLILVALLFKLWDNTVKNGNKVAEADTNLVNGAGAMAFFLVLVVLGTAVNSFYLK